MMGSAGWSATAAAQDSARRVDLQLIRNEHHIERFMLQRNLLPALEQCVLGEQREMQSAFAATEVCIAKASVILQYRFGLNETVFRSSEFTHYLEEQGETEVALLSQMLPQPLKQFTTELSMAAPGSTTTQLRDRITERVAIVRMADDRLAFVGTVLSRSSSRSCDTSTLP